MIIEESLIDASVLSEVKVVSTNVEEVTESHKTPWVSQWTMHTIQVPSDKAEIVAARSAKPWTQATDLGMLISKTTQSILSFSAERCFVSINLIGLNMRRRGVSALHLAFLSIN